MGVVRMYMVWLVGVVVRRYIYIYIYIMYIIYIII